MFSALRIKIIKFIIALLTILTVLFYFNGDSTWYFEPPGKGVTIKIQGTVPKRTQSNFGGFYKGFPGSKPTNPNFLDW